MTRSTLWSFQVLGLTLAACAGSLENPAQFESDQGAATANEDSGGDTPLADGGAGASGCGSTLELLAARCGSAGCHGSVGPAAQLDLVSDGLAERLKDLPSTEACSGYSQINSKDPAQSLLYLKVTDTPPCQPRMPIGTPLSSAEQACMLDWLEQL